MTKFAWDQPDYSGKLHCGRVAIVSAGVGLKLALHIERLHYLLYLPEWLDYVGVCSALERGGLADLVKLSVRDETPAPFTTLGVYNLHCVIPIYNRS